MVEDGVCDEFAPKSSHRIQATFFLHNNLGVVHQSHFEVGQLQIQIMSEK
jgi:hypothetical protein